MEQTIFKRYENKYLITQEQYDFMITLLQMHTKLDAHCTNNTFYFVNNIYFDTINNDIIRLSLDKPKFKEKLRLRSYQSSFNDNDHVFLELKKKYKGIVYKRRVNLTYKETINFVEKKIIPERDDYCDKQIIQEINYFLSTNNINKKVFINYQRLALTGIEQPDLRITIDKEIYYHNDNDVSNNLLTDNTYLMEIKTATSLPLWLVNILSIMQIYSTSFSKYGKLYTQSLTAKTYESFVSEKINSQQSVKGAYQYV